MACLYTYIEYMNDKHILWITFLNEFELFFAHSYMVLSITI